MLRGAYNFARRDKHLKTNTYASYQPVYAKDLIWQTFCTKMISLITLTLV
jgi:hypothetical protein